MILLGIDYGTKRIGLATGDLETGFAFPLKTVTAGDAALDQIASIVAAEKIDRIVVGMPYRLVAAESMDGQSVEGDTQVRVAGFIAALGAKVAVPIVTEDERMTTALVKRMQQDQGGKKSSFDKDAAAAAAILQTYIDRHR
jgi:putative holliday junction resolvase